MISHHLFWITIEENDIDGVNDIIVLNGRSSSIIFSIIEVKFDLNGIGR